MVTPNLLVNSLKEDTMSDRVDAVAQAIADEVARVTSTPCVKWGVMDGVDRDDYRGLAQAAIDAMGLMQEYRTCEDGSGGVSSRCDAAGRIISTTRSGRSPTEMRRFVTAWEVSREAVEHSHTEVYDEPITITSHQ